MHKYVFKRLLWLIPIILGVSLMIYLIMDLAPGNIIQVLAPADATEEQVQQLKESLGYDKPILERYLRYMGKLLTGDMGNSYINGDSVFKSYMARLPATIKLGLAAFFIAMAISIPLGILASLKQNSVLDSGSTVFAMLGLSTPSFWLGLILMLVFSLKLGLLPSGGDKEGVKSIILPAVTLGISLTAGTTRTTRSAMLDVLRSDFLRTARAKGVPEGRVVLDHAFGNAMIPIITSVGNQLLRCLGGSAIIETVFSWPGVGRLLVDAINNRDVPMVTGVIILKTIWMSVILLMVDVAYAYADPRIKAQYVAKKVKT